MQDKEDKLDELYKTKLKEFKLPVSDKVLTNIKKEVLLENKKKGFGYGFWTLLILVIAGAAIGGYFIISKQNKSTTDSISTTAVTNEKENSSVTSAIGNTALADNTITTTSSEINKTNEDEKRNENNTTSKTTTTNSSTNTSRINEKTKSVNTFSSDTNKANGADNRVDSKSKSEGKENNKNNNSAKSTNRYEPTTKDNSSTNKTSAGQNKSTTLNNNSKAKSIETTNSTTKTKGKTKPNEDVLNSSKENRTAKSLQKTTDSINSTKEIERVKQNGIRNDSIQKYQLAKVEDSIKLKQNPPPPPLVEDKKENKKEDKITSFFIGITGGPSFGNRLLTIGNNQGAANRNENEKSVTTYNAGIDAGVSLKNHLVVNIGIRLNNKSENYHIDAIQATSDTTMTPIYDSAQNIIGYTLDSIYTPGRTGLSAQNKYQWLSIPIMVGYNFSIKDKLFITPRVGVSIDYLLSGSSSWVDTKTNQIVEYTKSNGSFSNVTISGKINLDIGWNISKKWSLVLQPGYTRSLNSIYKKGDELKLYPYSYDLNLGVRFKF